MQIETVCPENEELANLFGEMGRHFFKVGPRPLCLCLCSSVIVPDLTRRDGRRRT
jgi:hypothetical protein